MATNQETLNKWKEQGFEPTQRALEVDAWIDSRNPEDNPDEFTWIGSMGYVYTGPARFYTTGSEHTSWLNSKLGKAPYETAYDVARAIDNHPAIPKGYGLFAPLDNYNPPPSGQMPGDVRPNNPPPQGQQVSNRNSATMSGNTFEDIYEKPQLGPNYMTQSELDAYNQVNGTNFRGKHLRFHPETGEKGIWTWDPMAGWRDDTKWLGPRTRYPDGTPIASFGDSSNDARLDPSPQATAPAGQQVRTLRGQAQDNRPRLGNPSNGVLVSLQDNRPEWGNLNPMGGMLTSMPMMQSPIARKRNQLINNLLGKRLG